MTRITAGLAALLVACGPAAPDDSRGGGPGAGPAGATTGPDCFLPSEIAHEGRDGETDGNLGPLTTWGPLATLPDTHFVDVTSEVGLQTRHGFIDDFYTNGQAFGDVDGDGWLDLYVTDSLGPNYLYLNQGDGRLSLAPHQGQVGLEGHHSGGALFADIDNDGDQDLYVLNLGANVLFRNDGVRGFTDITEEAGVGDRGKGQSAAFGDFDEDGDLDLYVVNWWCVECAGSLWQQATDRLYENLGDGRFRDVTSWLGFEHTDGAGYAATWLDYDNDGDLDLYVANDKGFDGPRDPHLPFNQNVLYENRGAGCGGWCLVEVSRVAGADLRMEGMGIAVGDFDQDLDLDLFVTNTGQPKLLENHGNRRFSEVSEAVGVIDAQTTWGTAFLDYDNDGDLDLYAAVGETFGPTNRNRLFENLGDGTFAPTGESNGAGHPRHNVGVAVADLDKDGGLDLVVGGLATDYRVFANLAAARARAEAGHRYTRVRLVGDGPVNRDAVGARVYAFLDDGRNLMAEVKSGASNGAGHDLALHFGLGTADIVEFEVRWPDGRRDFVPSEEVPLDAEWTFAYVP